MKAFLANLRNLPRYKSDLAASLLLLLLTLAFFWRTLSGDVYQPADGGDLVSLLFPTYRFAADSLSQGVIPLWNPHIRGGAPFIADIQAGFLYLPNLLLFLLNPRFDYKWLQWLAIGHLYWAGLGMYFLLRSLRNGGEEHSAHRIPQSHSSLSALFGALAFQFSDAFFIHLGNLNLIAVLSWLPWVLIAFTRALHERSLRWAAIAGLLFALGNYAGHAQSSLYLGMALGLYWLFADGNWRWSSARPGIEQPQARISYIRSLVSTLPYLVATFLVTVLLNAPILLPAFELTRYTVRADLTYQESVNYSLDPVQALAGIFSPGFFGRGPALHWSYWARVELPYVGVATFLLAMTFLLTTSKELRRRCLPWIAQALVGLLISLGTYGILHGLLYWILPGFSQFRAPARAIILWALALPVLASYGVEWFIQTGSAKSDTHSAIPSFVKWGGLFFALLLTPLIYATLLVTQSDPTAFFHASLAALAILIATALWLATWALLAALRAGWMSGTVTAALLVALLFIDFTSTGAYTDISSSDPTRGFQHPEIIQFLQSDPELFRIDTRTSPDSGTDCIWQPNTAALVSLQDVCGDPNPLTLSVWKELWDSTGSRASQRYDMLNVKYVIVRDGTPLPGEGKFELAFDAPDELSVYRNRNFLPRAWLTHDAQTGTPDPSLPPVTMTHYGTNDLSLQFATPQPATLVLSELWYPGWQATINGIPAEVKRNEIGLRTLDLPVGEATVQLWFAPQSWTLGLIGAAIGILLFAAMMTTRIRGSTLPTVM
ncbi:MAG: hypothetical protein U0175_12480 [Caldilineaceae bacterium]